MLSLLLSVFVGMSTAKEFKADNYCYLNDVITYKSVKQTMECLKTKKKLFVNSPGGMVDAGELLLNYVNKKNVTVMCLKCYSMAAFLWLNADKKEFTDQSELMFHYAYIVFSENTPLKIDDMRTISRDLELESEKYLKCLSPENQRFFIRKMKQDGEFYLGIDVVDVLEINYTKIDFPGV